MKLRRSITLGAVAAVMACLAAVGAHAQLSPSFNTNGHKGFAAPGGGGNLYVAGTVFPNLIEGIPYSLTNNFGFGVTANNDTVTLVPNPQTAGLNLFMSHSTLLTDAGPVDIGDGNTVTGKLSGTVSNGGNPMPDFQLKWTIDLVKTSDQSSLGSQSFLIDVSVNPPLDDASSTPEPGSIALLTGLGLAGSTFLLRRRRK